MSGEVKQTGAAGRVCILLDLYTMNGVEKLATILCKNLLKAGFQADLLYLRKDKITDRVLRRVPDGVRVTFLAEKYPYRHGAWFTCINRILSHLSRIRFAAIFAKPALRILHAGGGGGGASRSMADYIEAERPDVIYSTSNVTNIIALSGRRAARRKMRSVFSMHLMHNSNYGDRINRIRFALMSYIFSKADAVHVVSRGLAEEMVRKCGIKREKIVVIHNPMFNEDLQNLKRQKCDHPWIAEKGEEKVLLWAGRGTSSAKDLKTLLRAFRILSQRRDVRLILLGTSKKKRWMGGRVRELYESVQDRVLLAGYAENPYAWMAGADAFVLSSKSEGLPTVLIEALGCGCPVVSTDCEHGPREILGDGRWGRLTPVGDAEALADAIDATLDNPPPAEELIARARDFSEERLMPQFMDLLGLPRNTRAC